MTVQRQTGLLLTIFTSAVVFNHWFHGELSIYDLVYGFLVPPLALTSIFENKLAKFFQLAIMASVGALMVYLGGDSIYLGVVIMAITSLRAFTYGFLDTWARTKISSMLAIFAVIIFVSTDSAPVRTLTWMMMGLTILWFIWSDLRVLVAKARLVDQAEKKKLEQKLATNESLLAQTVEAGVVLVKELRTKETENECEG